MPPIRKIARRAAARAKGMAKVKAKVLESRLRKRFSRPDIIGAVDKFEPAEVLGWVAVARGTPPVRAGIFINEFEAVSTCAGDRTSHKVRGEARAFRFALKDIWQYCGKSDRLTVRVAGKVLPIAQQGMYVVPPRAGTSTVAHLQRKFADGYVFGHNGKLQLSKKLDTDWQHKVTSLYDRVREILANEFGHDAFFIYGTLLGSVRENGFIGHDMDFDAAYLSKHTNGADAAKELQQVAFTLVDAGLNVRCMRTALHIHDETQPTTRIDLFHLYFDKAGKLCFPFGIAGTTEITKDEWRGTREIDFADGRGLVPVNAEAIVEHIYGANWRTPNAGFEWDRDRTTRAVEGFLPLASVEEVYWANFYARTEYTSGSTFFDAVNARPDTPGVVIDIGCGDGRDSFAFGTAGRRVLGVDRSHIGVQHAAKKAQGMGFADRVTFQGCDVSDADLLRSVLTEALAEAGVQPVLFYARFFLHSIPQAVQDTLMDVLSQAARPGDYFAAEFRTDKDKANTKVHTKHYRRFQNGPAFGVQLREQYGFTVLAEQEGTGLSPYHADDAELSEDPELYRVIARR